VLLSSNARIDREVLLACPDLRYVGMCCSLYSEESANVDIPCARERGILVKGIRDYGDRGVVEYVLW
jgi:phosphoglycerate dehydrogenase-like enzyme